MDDGLHGEGDIHVPEGRDRLGRAHQFRVDVAIAISLAPSWLRKALGSRDVAKARSARIELVERISVAIERRFQVTWIGSEDASADARPRDCASPLFGGPETERGPTADAVDLGKAKEHKVNDSAESIVGPG